MPLAATVLSVCWFLTAFVLRIAIQVRRYHDTGVRSNAGPPLSIGWWARVLFTTSIVVVALAPALAATGVIGLVPRIDSGVAPWLGVVLAIGGTAATFVAQLAMGDSWRIGVDSAERTELVTTGVFAVVRNPIFTTMAVTGLGLTLMAPTFLGAAGLVVLVVALEVQVRAVEEPYLRQTHPVEFAAYAARTGRFLPGLGRRRPAGPQLAGAAPAAVGAGDDLE